MPKTTTSARRRQTAVAGGTALPVPNGTDKRERILAVAEELFFQYGYLGTTLDMICERLRTTKPFVYYYFAAKQEIFEAITWRASEACMSAMKFPASDKRPAHLKLAEGLHRFMAACVANFRSGALAYRDTASLRPEFHTRLRRLARAFYADIGALLEEGRRNGKLTFRDTNLTARAITSVGAFMYAWYIPAARLSPEEMAHELTMIAFKMVGLRTPAQRAAK